MLDRINKIVATLGFTQAQFADYIGVNRAIMNHIFTRRNKASLEVISKILITFKQISPDWLLHGEGPMMRTNSAPNANGANNAEQATSIVEKVIQIKMVDHITIYYEDNTYCNYFSEDHFKDPHK